MAAQAVCPAALAPATRASLQRCFPAPLFLGPQGHGRPRGPHQPQRPPSQSSPAFPPPRRRSPPAPRRDRLRLRRGHLQGGRPRGRRRHRAAPVDCLVKMSPLVSELRLYDIANVKGVAADLSHCNTPASVRRTFPALFPHKRSNYLFIRQVPDLGSTVLCSSSSGKHCRLLFPVHDLFSACSTPRHVRGREHTQILLLGPSLSFPQPLPARRHSVLFLWTFFHDAM